MIHTPEVSGISRAIANKLQLLDNRKQKVDYYIINAYHPDSGRSQDEHEVFLEYLGDVCESTKNWY